MKNRTVKDPTLLPSQQSYLKLILHVTWRQYGPVLEFYPRTGAGGQSDYTVHYFLHYWVVRGSGIDNVYTAATFL